MIHFVCLLQVKGFTSCKQSQVVPYSDCVVVMLTWSLGEAAESSRVCCAVLMYSAAICARSIHCNYCLPSNRLLHPKFEPSSDVIFTI